MQQPPYYPPQGPQGQSPYPPYYHYPQGAQTGPYAQPTRPYYPQPGGMQPPPPLQPPKKRRLRGCLIGSVIVIALFLCAVVASAAKTGNPTASPASSHLAVIATIPPQVTKAQHQPKPTTPSVPTVAPTVVPTQPPAPTQLPAPTPPPVHTGVYGNPWGYDFNATSGSLIYQPNPAFCDSGYFTCVNTFWKDANGYVSQCADGKFTHSGSISGECSRNGGKGQKLYSH